MVAFEQGIESNVSDGTMLDGRIETLNHDCFPIVTVRYRTEQAIYRALSRLIVMHAHKL
jgi:hypothetical protein